MRAVEQVARYIFKVTDRPESLRRLSQLAGDTLGQPAEELVMTVSEMLIEQGRKEGEAKGRREEAARNLLRMLQLKFGGVPLVVEQRVQEADVDSVERWMERIFMAGSAAEVVA